VFALHDTPDEDKDREVAKHQYNVTEGVEAAIDAELLREYIAYARQNVDPSFDDQGAVDILVDKYVSIRQDDADADEEAPVPVTARMNENLRRIAEAAARAELSPVVKERHAERALELYQMTIGDIGLTEDGNVSAAKMQGISESMSQADVRDRVIDYLDANEGETVAENEIATDAEVPQDKARRVLKDLAGGKRARVTSDSHNEHNETMWRIL
jgi:replicative DNA helicase Mcm